MLKKWFDPRSLSLSSVLLGVVALFIDAVGHFEGPPKIVLTIVQVVGFILVGLGLHNAAEMSEANILKKFQEFSKSKFGASIFVSVLTYLANQIPLTDPAAPEGVSTGAKIAGAILAVLLGVPGLREMLAKARLNNQPIPSSLLQKYATYKE